MSGLRHIITSTDPEVRDRSLDAFCRAASLPELLAECADLETFRRASDNLMSGCVRCFSSTPSIVFICRTSWET